MGASARGRGGRAAEGWGEARQGGCAWGGVWGGGGGVREGGDGDCGQSGGRSVGWVFRRLRGDEEEGGWMDGWFEISMHAEIRGYVHTYICYSERKAKRRIYPSRTLFYY